MAPYIDRVLHVRGADNAGADALSRPPIVGENVVLLGRTGAEPKPGPVDDETRSGDDPHVANDQAEAGSGAAQPGPEAAATRNLLLE